MDLTTTQRVKECLGINGSASDVLINQLIKSVGYEIERLMDRHAHISSRTELYQMRAVKRLVLLKGYPVDTGSAVTVKVSTTADFTTADTLTANEDYILDPQRGELRFLGSFEPLRDADSGRPIAPIYVQVTYTSGMATSTANFITSYPELAQACDMQCVHEFKRRSMPGQTATDMGDSSAQYTGELALIALVREAARRHRRMVWGG